jgi:hypothetical protein
MKDVDSEGEVKKQLEEELEVEELKQEVKQKRWENMTFEQAIKLQGGEIEVERIQPAEGYECNYVIDTPISLARLRERIFSKSGGGRYKLTLVNESYEGSISYTLVVRGQPRQVVDRNNFDDFVDSPTSVSSVKVASSEQQAQTDLEDESIDPSTRELLKEVRGLVKIHGLKKVVAMLREDTQDTKANAELSELKESVRRLEERLASLGQRADEERWTNMFKMVCDVLKAQNKGNTLEDMVKMKTLLDDPEMKVLLREALLKNTGSGGGDAVQTATAIVSLAKSLMEMTGGGGGTPLDAAVSTIRELLHHSAESKKMELEQSKINYSKALLEARNKRLQALTGETSKEALESQDKKDKKEGEKVETKSDANATASKQVKGQKMEGIKKEYPLDSLVKAVLNKDLKFLEILKQFDEESQDAILELDEEVIKQNTSPLLLPQLQEFFKNQDNVKWLAESVESYLAERQTNREKAKSTKTARDVQQEKPARKRQRKTKEMK